MSKELIKRILTSICLITLLVIVFFYAYLLIISLLIVSILAWIEFNSLIYKIFTKRKLKKKYLTFFYKAISLIYLTIFSSLIFIEINQEDFNSKLMIIFLFCICILSDIGGLLFGKIFKGRKLTKISPNKTISGSVGSFTMSLVLIPIFIYFFNEFNNNIYDLFTLTIIVSLSCQLGDLFISYLKRKAKVKDTGHLLPGHGGILDRIDGILFAIPTGLIYLKFVILI